MNNRQSELKKNNPKIKNPIPIFDEWLKKAEKSEPEDACAMSVASVDSSGMPNVRVVLMRHYDEHGFVFFTNFKSQKGKELLANKKAASCFHWKSLRKCIRIRGLVEVVDSREADQYFFSRPRGSRIGAWASRQSHRLESRSVLEKSVTEFTARFAASKVPRPDFWSGFRIQPLSIEFWSNGRFRLHERIRYDRKAIDQPWSISRLYP